MIRVPDAALSDATAEALQAYQAEIDGESQYEQRVAIAAARFGSRNRRDNRVFDEVKRTLDKMCSGARRCMYCEDSAADEVEHHHPKALYPELVFRWENYLYACGPCNGQKNSRFGVIGQDGQIADVTRQRGGAVVAPLPGVSALLGPRAEDPLEFVMLDIAGDTFFFVPTGAAGTIEFARAVFTIGLLRLNNRDYLPIARREAYESYRARLREYAEERESGAGEAVLRRRVAALLRMQHPTVWQEMKRQRALVPELNRLFGRVPEAMNW